MGEPARAHAFRPRGARGSRRVLAVVVALPFHSLAGRAYRAAPFDVLAPQIAEAIPPDALLAVRDVYIAGNLYHRIPALDIVAAESLPTGFPSQRRVYLVVVEGKVERMEDLPGEIWPSADLHLEQRSVFRAPYRFAADEAFALTFIEIVSAAQSE